MPSILKQILPWSWALVWFMVPVSLKGSVMSLWLFGLLLILHLIFERPQIKRQHFFILGLPVLLFAWYFIAAKLGDGDGNALKYLERKAALLFIPFIMLMAIGMKGIDAKWAMRGFISSLSITGLIIVGRALFLIIRSESMDQWTYHAMMITEGIGAIYYSWFLSISIIFLLYRHDDKYFSKLRYPLIIFFLILLFMASSKLFIILIVPLTIWKIIASIRRTVIRLIIIAFLIGLIGAASIPFLQRMQEIDIEDFSVVKQDQFHYNTPFNGLSLRLVQWRFGLDILNEQNAWVAGTGPEDTQNLLDKKYIEHGVYTGDPEWDDTGYLGYNFHNQYVETTVGTGLIGLIILMLIFVLIIGKFRRYLMMPMAAYIVTALFFITESVIERQAGIILFCLLICTIKTSKSQDQKVIDKS